MFNNILLLLEMDVDAAEKVVAKKNRKAEKAKKASTKIQTSNLSIKGR